MPWPWGSPWAWASRRRSRVVRLEGIRRYPFGVRIDNPQEHHFVQHRRWIASHLEGLISCLSLILRHDDEPRRRRGPHTAGFQMGYTGTETGQAHPWAL